MWLFLNDGFISVVANRDDDQTLLVRARRADDIERIFGADTPVVVTPAADYRFRAVIPRAVVAQVLADHIQKIDYPNFKNSIRDESYHDAALRVWQTMHGYQREATELPFD